MNVAFNREDGPQSGGGASFGVDGFNATNITATPIASGTMAYVGRDPDEEGSVEPCDGPEDVVIVGVIDLIYDGWRKSAAAQPLDEYMAARNEKYWQVVGAHYRVVDDQ